MEEEGGGAQAEGEEQRHHQQQRSQPPGLLGPGGILLALSVHCPDFHLYGHNPTLQPVQLQRPQVGGDVGRVGLAAEQVEAEYKFLFSQGRQ